MRLKHSMKRTLLLATILLAAACASDSDKPKDANTTPVLKNPYSLEGTTIAVGVIPAATLRDTARNKDIEFSIDYPTQGGPYPIVIFSPEYGGSRASYVGLSSFWASHGYVVIKPSHADAGATRAAIERRMEERRAMMMDQNRNGRRNRNVQATDTAAQGQQRPQFRADPAETWETLQTSADWSNRVADIRFLIDSLPRIIEQYPEIKDRADTNKIGAGGHSYGALTAIQTATLDSRVKAVEAMSPPGTIAERGLTSQLFANLKIPAMFMTGSRDVGATETEDVNWRKQAFEASPAGDKWFVSIQGAGRTAFTGSFNDFGGYQPVNAPDMPYPTNRPGPMGGGYGQSQPMPRGNQPVIMSGASTGTVRTVSLAFWDAYLKNDNAGREYLNKMKTRGDLQVETK